MGYLVMEGAKSNQEELAAKLTEQFEVYLIARGYRESRTSLMIESQVTS